jgi:hypothetical protein
MQRIFATVGGVKNVSGMSVGELAKLKEMGKSALPRLQKSNPSLYIDLDTALRDPKTPKAELQNLLKLAGESSDDVYGKIPKSELVKPMDSIVKSQSDDLLKEAKKYKTADDFVNSFEKRFHQTSPEIAAKIEKEGFKTNVMGSGNSDILPVGVNTKITDKPLSLRAQGSQLEVGFPKNAKIKLFETRDAAEGYFYSHPDGDRFFKAEEARKAIDKKYGLILDGMDKEFSKLAQTNPGREVMNIELEKQSKIIDEWTKESLAQTKIAQAEATKIAKKEGWDVIQINRDLGGFNRVTDNTIILNPIFLKTKSQLIDIWNKANK